MATLDNIKVKLQKLMKLYEGAKAINSEAEANAASAAIQRLLTAYNIELSEVDFSEDEKPKVHEDITTINRFPSIGGKWERRLLNVICKWNFCDTLGMTKGKNSVSIFGRHENVETAKWLYDMLSKNYVAIGKSRFKEYQETSTYKLNKVGLDTYLRRYLMGCAEGLNAKFREDSDAIKKEDEVYSTKVTALVVRTSQEIREYMHANYTVVTSKARSIKVDNIYQRGVRDGLDTQLHKPVSHHQQVSSVKILG